MQMSKTKGRIVILLSILLAFSVLLSLIVFPVSAQDVTYTAPLGYCVWAIDFDIPDSSSGVIHMTQANGEIVTASWDRSSVFLPVPASTLNSQIGADTETFTLYPVLPAYGSIWNGENTTYDRQLKMGTGLMPPFWSRVVQTTIDPAVVVKYQLVSGQQIAISHELLDTKTAVSQLAVANSTANKSENNLVTLLMAYVPMLVTIFTSLMYWLKLLFVDNLIMTISLYVMGTMAYYINTSKNIFVFYTRYFKSLSTLYNFIANMFSLTIGIVTQVAAIVTTPVGAAAVAIAAAIALLTGIIKL